LKSFSDSKLVKNCKEGKKRFCEEIVKRYQNYVGKIAYGYTNDIEKTKEIIQDTFLKVIKSFATYRGEVSLKSWLSKSVINLCRDYSKTKAYREKRKQVSIDIEFDKNGESRKFIQIIDDRLDPLRKVCSNETVEEIWNAIAKLSEKHREVLVLNYEGNEYKEIAKITGTSIGTVKSRISEARKKLAKLLSITLYRGKKRPKNE